MHIVDIVDNVIPGQFDEIFAEIHRAGGRVYLIGGVPRDLMIHRIYGTPFKPKDYDFEVYGLSTDILFSILRVFGQTKLVGEQFGVYTICNPVYGDNQWAMPRTETKTGYGHKDFEASVDPNLPQNIAVLRRDFTMNTLMLSPSGCLTDYVGGIVDIENGIIRHTSQHFEQDPLRPLRGVRFSSQKGFVMDPLTAKLCASISDQYNFLPKDRVWAELKKWALGPYPDMGLEVLRETGWIENFPMLAALINCKQDKVWHPEGDVFAHTCLAVKEAANIAFQQNFTEDETLQIVFGALLHDVAKPATSSVEAGHIISRGHDRDGAVQAEIFFKRLIPNQDAATHGDDLIFVKSVATLVAQHMVHLNYTAPLPQKTVRRLARKIYPVSLKVLTAVIEADSLARGTMSAIPEQLVELRRVAALPDVQVMEKPAELLLRGQDLIDMGYKPGKQLGEILRNAEDALDSGEYSDRESALAWVRAFVVGRNYERIEHAKSH